MDYAEDQSHMFMRTGVLAGVHGAALTNMIWMRPHYGAVVEVRFGNNEHYSTMAQMLDLKYTGVPQNSPSDVANAITQAMTHVASKWTEDLIMRPTTSTR
jgi:capsular polysaccharide biosynthesis protein